MIIPIKPLQRRICGAILGTFLLLIGFISLAFDRAIQRDLLAIESAEANKNNALFERFLSQEIDVIASVLAAWSKWDDMNSYVNSPNDQFREANFSIGALGLTKSDLFFIFDKRGEQLDGMLIDRVAQRVQPAPAGIAAILKDYPSMTTFREVTGRQQTFATFEGKLLIMVAISISNTSTEVEPSGTAIMARFVTPEEIRLWGESLRLDVDLELNRPAADLTNGDIERSATSYNSRIPFVDLNNRTLGFVRLTAARTTFLQGSRTKKSVLLITMSVGGISTIVMLLLLNALFVRRFRNLSDQLSKIAKDPLHANPLIDSHSDELSELAGDINRVLEKLAELRIDAERANSSKSRFLANMSHEIRTPINGITGMLELLEATGLSTEQAEYVSAAMGSASDLTTIVSDILDIARIEARKIKVESEPFSLPALINDLAAVCDILAERKSLSFIVNRDAHLPECVQGDSGKIKQIILNLLSNAIKFTSGGAVVFQVFCENAVESQTARVIFAVSDTGEGLSSSDTSRLFEPFEQGDASISRSHGGAGLGLSISRELALLMHGDLRVAGVPGCGSCFTLEMNLPVVHASTETVRQELWWQKRVKPLSVLVAEDNAVNRLLVRRILEKIGCTVTVVENGQEAVSCARANTFDLILMDLQMPQMGGFDATREIRNIPERASVPIIAVTANLMQGERERCLTGGMNGYVSKPMKPSTLIDEIRAVLGDT